MNEIKIYEVTYVTVLVKSDERIWSIAGGGGRLFIKSSTLPLAINKAYTLLERKFADNEYLSFEITEAKLDYHNTELIT